MSDQSYDRFDDWISSMTDVEYEDWLENEASDKQRDRALTMREDLEQEELRQLEREQVYDTRDVSGKTEINVPNTRRDITIIDKSVTPQQETVVISPQQNQPAVVLPENIKQKEKKRFIDKLRSAFSFLRRKKK